MLRTLVIVYANGCFGSRDEATSKAKALFAGKRATEPCMLVVCESKYTEGGGLWDFRKGSDFSCNDPFGQVLPLELTMVCLCLQLYMDGTVLGHWWVLLGPTRKAIINFF